MLPRIASILQIALLLTCPCWCKSGLCAAHADCCGPREEAVGKRSCCRECGDCCEDQNAQAERKQPSKSPEPSEPAPPVGKCQCICGGAVLDEPVDASAADDSLVAAFEVVAATPSAAIGNECFRIVAPRPSPSGACTGRELRHLLASLVC